MYEILTQKKQQLDSLGALPPELIANLDRWFKVELTYTSNAIEGNTLSRQETALVLEKGITIGGKLLVEHLEATNHGKALDFIHSLQKKKPTEITEADILTIHEIILKGIDDDNAGCYRRVAVRISGSSSIMPNYLKVPELMKEFVTWLQSRQNMHPVQLAGEAHYRLVTIHPFADGNGRTARLLMNLILLMEGYPPAIINPKERLSYITSLETAQTGGTKELYEKIIFKAARRSLDIYLKSAMGQSVPEPEVTDKLLKIGQLAKITGETVATIRFWTNEGLLEVADITDSNYHLYSHEMVKICQKIQKFKKQRLTLEEVKKLLTKTV